MRQPIFKGARIGLGICAIAFGAALWPAQAPAQFGTIFGGDPPRPPSDVPSRPPSNQPPQQPPPTLQAPPPAGRGTAVQSQPLPPPPGAPAVPLDPRPQQQQTTAPQSPTPGLPPGQRQPRGAPQQTAIPAPVPEEPQDVPTPKIVNNSAVFSGLDKITGRIISFDVALNETVQFGALQVTPRACYTRPPTELPLTDGFVEVAEVTLQGEVRRIFTGWMFAASPGLHGVEHSIYDVWLTDCKEPQVQKVAEEPVAPAPQQQRQPARPQGQAAPRTNPGQGQQNPSLRPAQPPAPAGTPRGTLANPR
jgi:hypothetical protein